MVRGSDKGWLEEVIKVVRGSDKGKVRGSDKGSAELNTPPGSPAPHQFPRPRLSEEMIQCQHMRVHTLTITDMRRIL